MANEIAIINEESIKDKIYIIRGEKVMLDFELAEIYGYSTKRFNEQVKNNREKFDGFIFQLARDELQELVMSKFSTSRKNNFFKGQSGGTRKLPYAFSESGIYMLMTVLRGPLAIEQSRKLINIFKGMKDYLETTKQITTVNDIISLTSKVHNQEKRIGVVETKVDILMDNIIDGNNLKEFIILNGHKFSADVAYQTIYRRAKHSLKIVDDYIDIKTIASLSYLSNDIKVTLYSDNINKMDLTLVDDFIKEKGINITVYKTNHRYHDRFILIDEKILYHSGPSIKDAGNAIGMILEVDSPLLVDFIKNLIDQITV